MDSATLHDAIAEVCPIVSCTVGKSDDRSTWTYVSKPGATGPQITAADNVVATIPIETLDTAVPTGEFIARFTNAEYRKLQDLRMSDNGKLGKDWDNVTSNPSINMTKKKTQSIKTDLVAAAVLTQARADEIFA